MKNKLLNILAGSTLLVSTVACDKGSFSAAPVNNQFTQKASINNKVDIVWVVDGSLTMANHQANLADNFDSFISQFVDKGFDYHMVVASTDAWMREVDYNAGSCVANPNPTFDPQANFVTSADCHATKATYEDLTFFRDGDIYGTVGGAFGARTGNYLLTSAMNPASVVNDFKTNVKVGTRGDGSQESTFQSLRSVLRRNADGSVAYNGETHTVLSQFRRPDAFLAVIVISDEEDQSLKQDGTPYADINDYTQSFISFLDGYTGATAGDRKYSVSGIVLDDPANCQYGAHPQATQGLKYVSIANATRGTIGNICATDFSNHLNNISQKIITLATRFKISREPKLEGMSVSVNGQKISKDDTNGWSYFAENGNHYVEFNGTSVPLEDSIIDVFFEPKSL